MRMGWMAWRSGLVPDTSVIARLNAEAEAFLAARSFPPGGPGQGAILV